MQKSVLDKFLEQKKDNVEKIEKRLSLFKKKSDEFFPRKKDNSIDYSNIRKICESKRDVLPMETLVKINSGVERVGYVIDFVRVAEPKIFPNGFVSKQTLENVDYMLFWGYNVKWGEIGRPEAIRVSFVGGIPKTADNMMENLGIMKDPQIFLYRQLALKKEDEHAALNEPMTITIGMWQQLQEQLKAY